MTLKEKIQTIIITDYGNLQKICFTEDLFDELAIAFHRWMRKNDTQENADKYFHYTDKDMLNEFKKQKGL
jgi:hypothetical protein